MTAGRALALILLLLAAPPAGAEADDPGKDDAGDWDDAEDAQESFWWQILHPNRDEYLVLLVRGQQQVGQMQFALASATLAAAVALEPDEPEGHYWLGFAFEGERRWAECAAAFDALALVAPDGWVPPAQKKGDGALPFRHGVCLAMCGRLEESITTYQGVLAGEDIAKQTRITSWYNLGDSYHALGRLEEAQIAYQHAIDLAPNGADPMFALAVALDRDEQETRAVEVMEHAIRHDPGLSSLPLALYLPPEDAHYYRGLAYRVARDMSKLRTCHVSAATWPCRALSATAFKSYLAAAGDDGPWSARARTHLAELGGSELQRADVDVTAPAATQGSYVTAVLAVAPEVQKCLDARDGGLAWVNVKIPRAEGKTAPTAAVRVTYLDKGRADAQKCVNDRVQEIVWPAGQVPVEVSFAVLPL